MHQIFGPERMLDLTDRFNCEPAIPEDVKERIETMGANGCSVSDAELVILPVLVL